MRFVCLIVFNLFFCFALFAQVSVKQKSIPDSKAKSVKKLAAALTKDSCSDYDKAKRIYDWITANIKYDVWRYEHFRWQETTPKQTLRRRKALCAGYSLLFQALCKEAGIKAWVVEGYDKHPNYRTNEPYFFEEHAWNVFQVDGINHLVDATWGSGGIRRKMSVIVILKHPIYIYRSRFVRKYNERFFDADTNWFLQTHVPILPMWQLKTHALSVERFEKQNFVPDSLPKNEISFKSDIEFYDSKSKEDRWLHEGNKGHDFFERNNRTKAYHTYRYLIDYYKKYELGNKKTANASRRKIASAHADTVIAYGRKFLKDNAVRHRYVVDSINNRHKGILPFSTKLYKDDLGDYKKIRWQIKAVKAQIKRQRSMISKRHEGFAKMSEDGIEYIRKSYSKKHVDTLAKIIAGMKLRYDLNTKKIDSLSGCRHFWSDSVQTKMPELDAIHDSMVFVYDRCFAYIRINTALNKRLYPLYLIRMNQDSIVSARQELRTLQNNYTAVQRYIYTNYFTKQIDPINRTSVQLLKQNKSLIKRIAKLSTYNDEEKKLYRAENKKLYYQLVETTKRSEVKIQIMNKNIDWLKEYKQLLKRELKALRKELIWQQAIDHRSSKAETGRDRYYFNWAKNAVNISLKIKKIVR
jgi:hypothetical protein